ncbi:MULTISPECIES: hypothetical protein [unclassified Streptomyces]|uniref:hypothetical protein n=1 Tax=unclassified Streptomyces TaxID=2593676 RepID=UPI0028C3DF38|nr:hypothetical protein [Streptomyces sp. AM8-1-1]WNO70633.1 hypothetical protein RPQ07_02885 [Streptomyces sp. AM8-1-1]
MARVTFVDETTSGSRSDGWGLDIAEERLALREVIRRRVFQEVAEFHARGAGEYQGLVRPASGNGRADRASGAGRTGEATGGRMDPEAQCALALAAFERNGFLILVGDRQVEDLDEEIELRLDTEVTFLKLVPLVGG